MKTPPVVKDLDVVEEGHLGVVSGLKRRTMDQFGFKCSEEALGNGVSGPGEFHPQSLAEPDMSLSTHPAPIVQPSGMIPNRQCAKIVGSRCAIRASQSRARLPCPRNFLYFLLAQRTRSKLIIRRTWHIMDL